MNYRKAALGVLVVVVLGAVAWALAARLGGGGTVAGEEAVTFAGETLDGKKLDLSTYRGKPVVLNFWATWCGYCVQEMPDLVRFAQLHPEIAVIGVNVNDSRNDATEFTARQGMTFPVIYDPDSTFFDRFPSQGLPTTVFLDKNLTVTDTIVGATDLDGFENALKSAQ